VLFRKIEVPSRKIKRKEKRKEERREMSSRPAATAASTSYELVTIRVSHYNERARWALDHYGVAYKEGLVLLVGGSHQPPMSIS